MNSMIKQHEHYLGNLHANIDYAIKLCENSKDPDITIGIIVKWHREAIVKEAEDRLGIHIPEFLPDSSMSDGESLAVYEKEMSLVKARLPGAENAGG